MKKISILIVALIMTTVSFGQQTNEAKKLLDEIATKAASYKNIYIEFNNSLENKEAKISMTSKGNVTLKGDQFFLNYMGTQTLFDGKKQYLIIPEDEEVIIKSTASDEQDELITPSKIFTFYKDGFTYTMGELKTIKGRKIQFVKLYPISSKSDIKNVFIGIDAKTKHINQIITQGLDDNITTISILSFKTNQPISENLFIFDTNKYKDYEISEPN
ncbi:MAG: hypothetical protein COB98_02185 [Flavobacteriaceae bacterium]|nr:MAG: hypothetical protein COB98_02185 [Flavobacteriaceae bacterium]